MFYLSVNQQYIMVVKAEIGRYWGDKYLMEQR